ncbi:hypothetical protein D3C71_24870 [compost metagenome]
MNLKAAFPPDRVRIMREYAGEIVGSIIALALIAVVIFNLFRLASIGLQHLGVTSNHWQSFAIWYVVGLLCAFYWPWKYRANMGGLWRKTIPELFLLALSGPLALILGFPL